MNRRNRNLFGYALNCIYRYKIRTIVILVCLITSSFIFSSVAFLTDGLVREGELSLKYAPDITVQYLWTGRQTFINTSYIPTIETMEGVDKVVPRVWGYGSIGNTLVVAMGIDLKNMAVNPEEAFPLEEGRFLGGYPQDRGAVVIGKVVAEMLGLNLWDTMSILTESVAPRQYQVVGIFNSESNIYNADMILMHIEDARLFFKVPEDMATDLTVYVSNPEDADDVARGLSIMPNMRVLTKALILDAQKTTYGSRSGFFTILWYIVLICVSLIAFNQSVVVGHESKFEVGLLKALGFSTSDIIQIRLMESTILGVLAASLGLTFGIIYDTLFNAPVFREFMLGWATLYPSFTVPIHIGGSTILFVYAVTLIPLLFATVVPAWINATVDPDIAMRGAKA